jgi:hypothetical protein
MALVLADRVQETSTTSGTGAFTLNGAVSGYQSFATGIGSGNTVYYAIYDATAFDWETGLGTYTSPNTLTRTTVFANSLGTTAFISFAGNTTSVFATYPGSKAVSTDTLATPPAIGSTTANTGAFTTLSATTPIALGSGGTGKASAPAAQANLLGYTTTATAAGTTTLDNTSSFYQLFTGATTQTVVLPVTSTLALGWSFRINNSSTGSLTVNSSGGSLVVTVLAGVTVMCTCINTGVTDATGWRVGVTEVATATGTGGSIVLSISPSITGTLSFGGSSASNANFGTNQTTGVMTLGGLAQTGLMLIGRATTSQPIHIGAGITTTSTTAVATGSSISDTTLTLGTVTSGTFAIGMAVSGTNVLPSTYITAGSGLSWTVSQSQTVTSTTITGTTQKSIDIGTFGASGSITAITLGSATSGATSTTTVNGALNYVNKAVTVTTNAGTVPVAYKINTFTNSSAATMAITMAVTGAVDGQMSIVRIYDFSAATQTIGWTNTENSTVNVPTTSNGSTTLPLTVGFMYNSQTSRWRCIASA